MAAVCSATEAAEILGVDPVTVYRWIRSGRLASVYKMPGVTGAYVLARGQVDELALKRSMKRHPSNKATA